VGVNVGGAVITGVGNADAEGDGDGDGDGEITMRYAGQAGKPEGT
jgi:hypothetical protein